MMQNDSRHFRLAGLDTLRALAIVLVLLSHYNGFVAQNSIFGFAGDAGWAGVDLFFVLSGYLIGNQILSPVSRGEPLDLKNFFARRLLRTLPNYYAVLAVFLFLPHSPIAGKTMAPFWPFLSFTQNIGLHYGETFTHSWSLCIEEQFYLVLPLAVLALLRRGRSPRLLWYTLLLAEPDRCAEHSSSPDRKSSSCRDRQLPIHSGRSCYAASLAA